MLAVRCFSLLFIKKVFIDLFDIVLANPATNPYGIYPGTYILIGGMDGGNQTASDNLGQADFSVNVAPEPVMALPVLICLAGAAAIRRRRSTARG